MERAGITYEDLHGALADMDVYLDVNEEQLTQIYKQAGIHAMRRRMGEMNCEQIMSKDVVVIQREAPLDKAWDLLQFHRLRVLPVVDSDRTLVGIISALDVLSGVNRRRVLARERSLWQRLRRVFSTKGMEWRVADVMTEKVVTVSKHTHIADIVPLLSEGGYHHLPVVDEQQRLVGMVTQSDLIATLHAGLVAA
jgi:CBS domain-containing membrane protein